METNMSKSDSGSIRKAVRKAKAAPTRAVEETEEIEVPAGAVALKQMPWSMKIEGLEADIPITAAKLPSFTSGMLTSGDLAVETLNMPTSSFNHYFRAWLGLPKPRKVELHALTTLGESVERWKMTLVPIAMGFAEFDTAEEELWTTQVAFSATEIEIVPTNKIK
jgi:hypothetical protein